MGDLQVSSAPLNGAVFADDRLCSSPLSPPLSTSNPDLSLVAAEAWSSAEKTTHKILCTIQPTLGANQRRKEVVEYVQRLLIQRLIEYSIRCEVFPYGSVPLKTYLPDGDIDLTALSSQNIEDALVFNVHAILRGEEGREGADYEVKDVRFIDAEVKLVKCIVQNIVVDISFNQLGGLSTLCFLEQVDHLVGKDHLFKRSIILIKAWCYYESRILGAHHGLISTYALETLVLYIFHQFHSSLNGPLAVLYRFLDYFSKFDWENYCVSLKGPVSKSSLPDIVAKIPENGGTDLLLTEEFIRNCVELFSVPSRGIEPNLRVFPSKHLNIIDPLRENNNLGRSVNRGNFYRIRSAFKYGARKLGWILMLPEDRIADELNKFFENTLGRHGSTQWDDMQNPSLTCSVRGADFFSSLSDTRVCSKDMAFLSLSNNDNKDVTSGNQYSSEIRSETERNPVKDVTSQVGSMYDFAGDRNVTLGYNLGVHSKNVATAGALDIMTNTNGSFCSDARRHFSALVSEDFNRHLTRENGKAENGFSCRETDVDLNFDEEKEKSIMVSYSLSSDIDEKDMASYGSEVSNDAADIFDNSSSAHGDKYSAGSSEGYKASKLLLELTGDYDCHIRNLKRGKICNGYAISPPVMPSPPKSPNLQNRNPWQAVRRSKQTNHNIHLQPNSNGFVGQVYIVNHPTLPIMTFAPEESRKPRGTGAYLPNMTSREYRDRPSQGRGRNQAPVAHGHQHRHARNNGLPPSPAEVKLPVEGRFEHALEGYPVIGSLKPRSPGTHFSHPSMRGSHYANGSLHSSEKSESGHLSPHLHEPRGTEVSSHPQTVTFISRGSVSNMRVQSEENSNSLSGVDHQRIDMKAYRLKNEDDFPPLSHREH